MFLLKNNQIYPPSLAKQGLITSFYSDFFLELVKVTFVRKEK